MRSDVVDTNGSGLCVGEAISGQGCGCRGDGGGPAVTDYCVERRFNSKIVARLRYDEKRKGTDRKDDDPIVGSIGDC